MNQISEAQRLEANFFLSLAQIYRSTADNLAQNAKDLEEASRQFRKEANELEHRAGEIIGVSR